MSPATVRVIEADGRSRDHCYWRLHFGPQGEDRERSYEDWQEITLDALRKAVEARGKAPVEPADPEGTPSRDPFGTVVDRALADDDRGLGAMRLELTRRADYAIRTTICLAREGSDRLVSAPVIARRMEVPARFLPQIMQDLTRAGIVEALPGRGGGYRLTRVPNEVSLLEVIEAVEVNNRHVHIRIWHVFARWG